MAMRQRWRRGVLLSTLVALLGMHGVSAGHDAMAAMSTASTMSAVSSGSMAAGHTAVAAVAAATAAIPSAEQALSWHQAQPSSHSAGLLITTCLALLGLGAAVLRQRGSRLRASLLPACRLTATHRHPSHWPRGPDPVLDLCTSRT